MFKILKETKDVSNNRSLIKNIELWKVPIKVKKFKSYQREALNTINETDVKFLTSKNRWQSKWSNISKVHEKATLSVEFHTQLKYHLMYLNFVNYVNVFFFHKVKMDELQNVHGKCL